MTGKNFAERLVLERKRLGLSATDVWKTLGIHRNSQSYYEHGQQLPNTDYLAQLFGLGFDVQYLVTGLRSLDSNPLTDEQRTLLCAFADAPVSVRQPLLAALCASAELQRLGST